MRTEYLIAFLLFFPILIIQTTIIPLISINGVLPDLILILLVYYSIRLGQVPGTVLGFIYGFLFDLITGNLLGSAMLAKTVVGFIAGYFSNENKRDVYLRSYVFSLIVLLCAVVDSITFSFLSTVEFNRNIFILFYKQGMLPGFYTAVISIALVVFNPRRSIR